MAISLIDRWNSDGNSEQITICIGCKHLSNELRCNAFPDGIPAEILNNKNDHSKPLPGQQNDFVFEPR